MYEIKYSFTGWPDSEVWSDVFLPEGFELKEKDSHKKERLVSELDREHLRIETYKRYIDESEEKIKTIKKELKEL